ncbi:uncharacterized protein LOC144483952 [Mustelus asterias]
MEALKRVPHSSGENVHSFLIGARYNRTNYLDSKAVEKHGLFICRNKPHIHFMADHGKEPSKKIHTQAVSTLLQEPIVCFKQTTSATYVRESDLPPAPGVDRLNNKVSVPWGISTKKANDKIHMSNEKDSTPGKPKSSLIKRCVFHSTAQKVKRNKERKIVYDKNPEEMLITKLSIASKALTAHSSQTCRTISDMHMLPNKMQHRRTVCATTDQNNAPSLLVKSMKPLVTCPIPPAPPSSRGSSQRSSITNEICKDIGPGGSLSALKIPINLSANDDGCTEEKDAGY